MASPNLFRIFVYLFVFLASLQQGTEGRTVCGPALDNILRTICVHGFNSKFKKSLEWDQHGSNELLEELPFPYGSSPFMTKAYGGGHFDTMAKTRRRRLGVYDECCNNGCTYDEILSYCYRREDLVGEYWNK